MVKWVEEDSQQVKMTVCIVALISQPINSAQFPAKIMGISSKLFLSIAIAAHESFRFFEKFFNYQP